MGREKEGIYKITCKVNDKVYIGRSIDIDTRLKSHKLSLKRGKHANKKLQADFNKYGEDAFIFEVEKYTDKPLDTHYYESYYAEKYKAFEEGYNIGKLSKSETIKKIVDNLDYYIKKLEYITNKIPSNIDCDRILIINDKVREYFELDNYEIGVLVSIISSYIGLREGLSIVKDINMRELYFSQVDMRKLEESMESLYL